MKDLSLLSWLTQLGLTVAFPLGGFIWLGLWLQKRFSLGSWVLWLGIILGTAVALEGFRSSLRTLMRFSNQDKKDPPGASFNEHD